MFRKISLFFFMSLPLCLNATWSTAANLSTVGFDSSNVAVALSSNGSALASWSEFVNGGTIYASAYQTGNWDNVFALSSLPASLSCAAINASGNGVVVWVEWGDYAIVKACLFSSSTGWGSVEQLSIETGNANNPKVSMNDAGTIIVVWEQDDGQPNTSNLFIQGIVNSGSWGSVTQISSMNVSKSPEIKLSHAGNALVLWNSFDSVNNIHVIRSAEYTGTWSSPIQISVEGEDSFNAKISMNTLGEGMATWAANNGSAFVVHAKSFSTVWNSTTETLSDPSVNSGTPQVSLNDAGNCIIAWNQSLGSQVIINAAEYSSGLWSAPEMISTSGINATQPVQLNLNNNGHAVAIWTESDNTVSYTQFGGFSFSSGVWGNFQSLSDPQGYAINPVVDFNDTDNALALWQQLNGATFTIQDSLGSGL